MEPNDLSKWFHLSYYSNNKQDHLSHVVSIPIRYILYFMAEMVVVAYPFHLLFAYYQHH